MASNSPNREQRLLACRSCRSRKIKCDHNLPCSNCIKSDEPCIPTSPAPPRPKRPQRMELRERLMRCEKLLEQMKYTDATSKEVGSIGITRASKQQSTKQLPLRRDALPSTGKILVDQGAVRFTDRWLWGTVFEEVLAMKSLYGAVNDTIFSPENGSLLDPHQSHDDQCCPSSDATAFLEPLPSQMYSLWQVFLDRIHPLIKIIHASTVQPHLVDLVCSAGNPPDDIRALLFAIFCLASLSLGEEECWSMLGSSRDQAFHRLSAGIRIALRRARFLEKPNLTVLQALTLYLMALRSQYGSREIWILNSVCIRMAQKMGLHRDGESLGLSPFETEMRRRLWWQIVILDVKSARASGLSPSSLPSTIDCKMPTNIDDDELRPDATEPFKDQEGPTDMIICLIFCKVGQLATSRANFPERMSQGEALILAGQSDETQDVADFKNLIRDLKDGLQSVMKQYSDRSAGPIHELASTVTSIFSSKFDEMSQSRGEQPEWGTEITSVSDHIFKLSILSIEHCMRLHEISSSKVFSWSILFDFHYDVFAHMVAQLSFRTSGSLVERAWNLIPMVYSAHQEFYDTSKPSNMSLASFVLGAWSVRSDILRAKGDYGPEIPVYIQRLESDMKMTRI